MTDLQLSPADVTLILEALNTHEGILSTDFEQSQRCNSVALSESLRRELVSLRALATRLYPHAE